MSPVRLRRRRCGPARAEDCRDERPRATLWMLPSGRSMEPATAHHRPLRSDSFRPLSGELADGPQETTFREWSRADHDARARITLRVAAVLMLSFCLAIWIPRARWARAGGGALRVGSARAVLRAARSFDERPRRRPLDVVARPSRARRRAVRGGHEADWIPAAHADHRRGGGLGIPADAASIPAASAIGSALTVGYLALTAHGRVALGPLVAIAAFVVANAIGLSGHAWSARAARSSILRLRAAEDAHAERLSFLASTSHELRSPLHGIVACAELLEGTTLDEEQRGLVSLIRSSGLAMSGLLEEAVHQVRGGHELPAIDSRALDLHAFHDDAPRIHACARRATASWCLGQAAPLRFRDGSPPTRGPPPAGAPQLRGERPHPRCTRPNCGRCSAKPRSSDGRIPVRLPR